MSTTSEAQAAPERDLVLTRLIEAPREALFKAWSDPTLLMQWWAPFPYTVPRCDIDFRPGGSFRSVIRASDGREYPHGGVYLDIVPSERIVFTDAYSSAWVPSAKPFVTASITFEEQEGATLYTARVMHWTAADRDAHEAMGFQDGWGRCADQLAAVARAL